MPNIKSAIKRLKTTIKKTKSNTPIKGVMKSSVKKVEKNKDPKDLKDAIKKIDKALKKGVIKKNTAARKKARISKIVNKK
ncbi:MAG: 30S ribosomal protein S20 [Bacilli bacterium]|nr:30S ribosomal protein S20 [Bacilli bacterium]